MSAPEKHRARIAVQDANMPAPLRDVMSAPQPTPGPWRYDSVWSLVLGPEGDEQQICAIHGSELVPKQQAAANAALIARAPDLLAEVERLRVQVAALKTAARAALEASVCLKQGRILSCMIDPGACDCFRCKAANQLRAALA